MAALSVDQVLSGEALGLTFGLGDILVLDFAGRRVLYALSRTDGKLVEVDVQVDGTLTVVGSLELSGEFAVGNTPLIDEVAIGGGVTGIALSGMPVLDGQVVSLSSTGALGEQQSLGGVGTLIAPSLLEQSLLPSWVSGRLGGGLDLFRDTGTGVSWVAGIDDDATTYLSDVADSVAFSIGESEFVATISALEDGVNLVGVDGTSMAQVAAIGASEGVPINAPSSVDALQRMGETLLIVGASGSSSLSVLRTDTDGSLSLGDHVVDSSSTRIQSLTTLDATTIGDFAFVAAGGIDGGVSLFTALPGGRLIHLGSVSDDDSTTLYRVSAITLSVSGDSLQIISGSHWEPGLTRISYDISGLGVVLVAAGDGSGLSGTVGDDQLVGSALSEVLSGGEGDDILFDNAGEDTLIGGAGADLFVFHSDGQADVVQDFQRGVDRLDLSSFDFLYDISQLDFSSQPDGALLIHGDEELRIYTADGAPLTTADLTNADILNVDRPPFLPIAQELIGNVGADTLNGAQGDDVIEGGAGDDRLAGQGGNDLIWGGDDDDWVDGGAGGDTIDGGEGHDTLIGGSGGDLIDGGAGNDLIYADEFDWSGG